MVLRHLVNFDKVLSSSDKERKPHRPTGKCPVCKKYHRVRKDGRLYKHDTPLGHSHCIGSGSLPIAVRTKCLCAHYTTIVLATRRVGSHMSGIGIECRYNRMRAQLSDDYKVLFIE